MSFLRNHLRHFVLPGIHTLARNRGKILTVHDIKQRDHEVRPASDCKFVEAGMLYAVLSSVLKKGDPLREVALGLCRQIGRAKDAEFVYEIDKRGGVKELGKGYDGIEGSDVLHSMLCNSMRRLKRKMRRHGQLLLPGRDVWCWEVMARKLTVDSTYDPRVSRSVAYNKSAIKTCIDDWKIQDWSKVLFFDTGFSGSIPRAIGEAVGLSEIEVLLLSSADEKKQIFRTHTGSRSKALAFEYLAKYFQSGSTRDGKPYQQLADLDEFIKAALLTIWLWYHVSPTRLPSYRDKKAEQAAKTVIKNKLDVYQLTQIDPLSHGIITLSGSTATTTASTWPIALHSDNTSVTMGNWTTPDIFTPVSALQTLDQLWGAGTSGQILLDKHTMAPSALSPAKKLTSYALDPGTFEIVDTKTGKSIEKEMDAKTLAIVKGKKEPTKEGFGFGEYPGPPVISSAAIKELAGVAPDGPLPEIEVSLESGPFEKGVGCVYKKTVFKTPQGEKVYKTPLTG